MERRMKQIHAEMLALRNKEASGVKLSREGCIPKLWHLDSRQPEGTHRPGTRLWEPRVVRARAAASSVERHCQ